jgi:hypothetical protein
MNQKNSKFNDSKFTDSKYALIFSLASVVDKLLAIF